MIKRIFKIIGIIILILIAIIVVYCIIFNSIEKRTKAEQDKVKVSVGYDLNKCSEDHPLAVMVTNETTKTVNSISIYLGIYRKRRSTDIGEYSWRNLPWDLIVEPSQTLTQCWSYKLQDPYKQYNNPNELEFKIDSKYTSFQ